MAIVNFCILDYLLKKSIFRQICEKFRGSSLLTVKFLHCDYLLKKSIKGIFSEKSSHCTVAHIIYFERANIRGTLAIYPVILLVLATLFNFIHLVIIIHLVIFICLSFILLLLSSIHLVYCSSLAFVLCLLGLFGLLIIYLIILLLVFILLSCLWYLYKVLLP